jgi:hypothetical protein
VAPEHVGGDLQRLAQLAHLGLVQLADRLDDAALGDQLLDDRHAVVMGLDHVRALGAAGLDRVGVDGALAEQHGAELEARGLAVEDVDVGLADRLALGLRLDEALEAGEEVVRGVDEVQVGGDAQAFEGAHDVAALVLAHQAVVDVQEVELLGAEGFGEQAGANGGVDSAGGEEEDAGGAGGPADLVDLLVDVAVHGPGRVAAADAEDEILQHLFAELRVVDLGVVLEAVALAPLVGDGGIAVRLVVAGDEGQAELLEAGAEGDDGVAVAHPDGGLERHVGEDGGGAGDAEPGGSVLALAVLDAAAVVLGDLLVAEAEAEERHVEVEDGAVPVGVLAGGGEGGGAGEDHAAVGAEGLERVFRLANLGQHVQAADLGGDQMGVLSAEIDDGNSIVVFAVGHGGAESATVRP